MDKPGKSKDMFTIQESRSTDHPSAEVIGYIRSPERWPEWQPEILSVTAPDGIEEGSTVHGRADMLGFVVEGRSTAVRVTDTAFEEDVVVGVRMKVTYEVQPDGDSSTIVTRRLKAHLPQGVCGRVLSFFLKRRLRRMQTRVLDLLMAQLDDERSN